VLTKKIFIPPVDVAKNYHVNVVKSEHVLNALYYVSRRAAPWDRPMERPFNGITTYSLFCPQSKTQRFYAFFLAIVVFPDLSLKECCPIRRSQFNKKLTFLQLFSIDIIF
jgi:hypothetical protein